MRWRAIFFEADHARVAASELARQGFDAEVLPERFAGEDDDLDHPWAVITEAPEPVVELLVERFEGWLDADTGPVGPAN